MRGVSNPDRPSDRIVEQRVRNRLIEYFELASSYIAQAEYAAAAPPYVHVPYEVIEQWEDWVPHLDLVLTDSQVYTSEEKEALSRFQSMWETTADAITDDYPSLDAVQATPEWEAMRREAESALAVLAKRGRLPED